jgi:hypothetical protein
MVAISVVLEWHFTPPNYFEQSITVSRDDYTMEIGNGKVVATIDAAVYDANPSMRDTLHGALNARFLAVQLLSHSPFELSKPTMARLHEDGHRDIFVELEGAVLHLSGGLLDVQVTDKDGNVVSDSKRDRINRRQSLADLVSAHSGDVLLAALFESHRNSVSDADNELVHLFEIRDALSTHFGGKPNTRAALGISDADWSRLGQLCNDEPLRQGRHRGQNVGALRDAMHSELEEARSIAASMVEKYLQHLASISGDPETVGRREKLT